MGKIISNGIEYSGIQGTTVIANPEGSPIDELSSIQIGNDIYEIVGGSSGGSCGDILIKDRDWTLITSSFGTTQLTNTYDYYLWIVICNGKIDHYKIIDSSLLDLETNEDSIMEYKSWNDGQGAYSNSRVTITASSVTLWDNNQGAVSAKLYGANKKSSGSASWKDITGTLRAGQTSITLTDSSILESSTFDFYTSKFGVNPTDVELVNSAYNFTEFMNGKIVVREHKTDTTDKKLFFIGLEKDTTDIDVTDTSLLEYLSDITNDYKKASYSYSNGTTRNGNIGFYNLGNGIKLRSWVIDWTQTLAGTFYGMIDLNEAPSSASSTEGQTNTYSDPYDVEGGYSLTLTFDEQNTDLDVKVRVTNETN